MKKLMTTLSAIAVAFGLHAVGMADTGTSFEGIEIPSGETSVPYDINTPVGELSGSGYWVTNETSTLTVMDCTGVGYMSNRPDTFSDKDQDRYLKVKTTLGNPVTRKVNSDGSGTTIGDSFYFDSLVKFTAFDSDPDINLGETGKLAIWLKETLDENEQPVATNLMITAGYLTGDGVVTTNYECGVVGQVDLSSGDWHRVTVRAIGNINKTTPAVPGFIVYIDNKYVAADSTKGIDEDALDDTYLGFHVDDALFPSAVQSGTDKGVIKSVDFDGQGDVDDLVFTATKPEFEEDVPTFKVALGEGVQNVTLATYDVGAKPIAKGTGTFSSDITLKWDEGMYVEVGTINYLDGYMTAGIATNGYVTVNGKEYTPQEGNTGIEINAKVRGATVVIGGTTNEYETVERALVERINLLSTPTDVELTLNALVLDGFTLSNPNANIVLDLAGNDISNATQEAAITLSAGSLTIIDSSDSIGHVVGNGIEGSDIAVYATGGTLVLDAGIYDGVVYYYMEDPEQVPPFRITGDDCMFASVNGDPLIGTLPQLITAVKAGIASNYTLTLDGDYYVVEQAAVTTYTVTFYGFNNVLLGTEDVEENGTITSAPEFPLVAGYEANGWLLNGEAYSLDTPVTADITLNANYEAIVYTITYELNLEGATNAVANATTYTVEDQVALLDAGCVGYTFAGWTNAQGVVVSEIALGSTDNVTFGATWIVDSYTITFDANGGVVDPATTNFTIESGEIILPEATPSELSIKFGGWTNATIVSAITRFTPTAGTLESFTLYAKWDPLVPTEKHKAGEDFNPPAGKTAAEFAAEINSGSVAIADYLVIPSGVSSSTDYCALFMATNVGEKVEFVLNEAAEAAAEADANAAAETIVATPGTVPSTLTIDAEPGLYYSISYGSTLTSMEEGARTQAKDAILTDGKITLDMPQQLLGATSGFYQVNVNIADKPSQD